MSENPEITTESATGTPVAYAPDHRDRRVRHILSWVGIVAGALFIVAVGLSQLFVGDLPFLKSVSFAWLRIESFGQLKLLLWDTFLVTLLVLFVTRLVSAHTIGWDMLVLPIAIALLTISSFLLKQKH